MPLPQLPVAAPPLRLRPTAPRPDDIPALGGRYRLIDRLAGGATGDVYLAEDAGTGRRVAVKVLADGLADDPVACRRLAREAEAAAAVDHPNVVRVLHADARHRPPYLVMEYVDGESLQAAVARTGTFRYEEAAACGRQVAAGLHAAHAAGLVHRDVKPANLLVDRGGAIKLLDLGVVRVCGQPGLTLAGGPGRVVLGTLDYLAPEQADDCTTVDGRADVYALGGTLYFLLAGHPPFPDPSPTDLLGGKRTAPPPVHRLRPDVPPELSAVIARMLAVDPADRPTPAEAEVELSRWVDPGSRFPADLFARLDQGSEPPPSHRPPQSVAGRPTVVTCEPTPVARGSLACWCVGLLAGLAASAALGVILWLLAEASGWAGVAATP